MVRGAASPSSEPGTVGHLAALSLLSPGRQRQMAPGGLGSCSAPPARPLEGSPRRHSSRGAGPSLFFF